MSKGLGISAVMAALSLAPFLVSGRAGGHWGRELGLQTGGPPPSLMADKGKFRIMANGSEAGHEEFEITPSGTGWVARATTEVTTSPGGPAKVSATLRLNGDGSPERYEWSSQSGKKASSAVAFQGGTATAQLQMEGAKPFTQEFVFKDARVAILDNNFFHQYEILAGLYDWNRKGKQNFAVLIPQEMTPGNIAVEWLAEQGAGTAKQTELRVRSEDLEVDLYLEGQRLVRVVSPASNVEAVRE